MQKIAKDIQQHNFKRVYLLYGQEDYLRKQYRDRLIHALVDPQDTMNYQYFEGKDISVGKVIDLAQTSPFLAEHRVIVMENSGFFQTTQDQMADYVKEIPEDTILIFVETQVDKRNRLFKACQSAGYVAEFTKQTPETLSRWITQMVVNREKKQITQRALDTFMEYVGLDMENIISELEKLFCYTMDKQDINEADVRAVCTRQIDNKIFDMIEAALTKRQKKALALYYDLIALKEPPRKILVLITKQCNQLYQTKLLRGKGYDSKSIASKLAVPPFVASKFVAQASKYPVEVLRENLEKCIKSEEDINTGKMTDLLCVEMLMIEFSKA